MTRIRRLTPLKELLPDPETLRIYKRLQHQYVRYGLPVALGEVCDQKKFIDAGSQFCLDYPETQFLVTKLRAAYSIVITKRLVKNTK